jgi:hypothetical protein
MLKNLLSQKRSSVLKKWFDLVLNSYPHDTSRFLKQEKNQFANPVGFTISQGLKNIYDELLKGEDFKNISPFLERVIRVRAVQEFSPSQAIEFVFLLKDVLRYELKSEIRRNNIREDLLQFESRIDRLAMFAFDMYERCREEIYEIRVNEIKGRMSRLLEKTNKRLGISTQGPDIVNENTDGIV